MDFYVYTSSGRCNLARDLYLDGEWEVALTEIHISSSQPLLIVTAYFVDTSLIGDKSLQIIKKKCTTLIPFFTIPTIFQ